MNDETESIYEAALGRGARPIAELRALLAPLLDQPTRDDGTHGVCVFCRARAETAEKVEHLPDCPVLRHDALLGRT